MACVSRSFSFIALIASLSVACGLSGPAVPAAVRQTLDGWRAIGLTCADATKDNVPSGLLQWNCHGALDGIELSGTLDGDDRGVFGLQVVVPGATPADRALLAFTRLVDATPPLDGHESEIATFISGWPPIATTGTFGDATVRVDVDDTWRSLTVGTGLQVLPTSSVAAPTSSSVRVDTDLARRVDCRPARMS